jgi:hypothetical protein
MTWANVQDLQPRSPRKNRIVILEDINFIWDEPELKEVRKMWKKGVSVISMAEHFERDPDEVLLAIMHLARNDKITARKSGLKGEED